MEKSYDVEDGGKKCPFYSSTATNYLAWSRNKEEKHQNYNCRFYVISVHNEQDTDKWVRVRYELHSKVGISYYISGFRPRPLRSSCLSTLVYNRVVQLTFQKFSKPKNGALTI